MKAEYISIFLWIYVSMYVNVCRKDVRFDPMSSDDVLWRDVCMSAASGALSVSSCQRKSRRTGRCCGLCAADKAGLCVSSELCSLSEPADTHTFTGMKYGHMQTVEIWEWRLHRSDNHIYRYFVGGVWESGSSSSKTEIIKKHFHY